jgi:hypothetical protein
MVPKQVTFYKVQVRAGDNVWTLERRFSEFDTMHKDLAKMVASVPEMPPKTYFKLTSHEGLMKRKQDLDMYLKNIISRPELLNHSAVRSFLEVKAAHNRSSTPTTLKPSLLRRKRWRS